MSVNPKEMSLAREIMSRTGEAVKKRARAENFFEYLTASGFDGSILYPANGFDFPLDKIAPHKRIYLDAEPRRKDVLTGNYNNMPQMLTGSIDAVFLQDTHAGRMGISEILRTVKNGGLIIVSDWTCGDEPVHSLSNDEIKRLNVLSMDNRLTKDGYTVLRKKYGEIS